MREIVVKSLESFLELYSKYHNDGEDYFRGQANANWDITPSIARNRKVIDEIETVEKTLIYKFKVKLKEFDLTKFIPSDTDNQKADWLFLASAQHYGLPTRLLDFSFAKEVALSFALLDPNNFNSDSAFIIYKQASSFQVNFDSVDNGQNYKSTFLHIPIRYYEQDNENRLSESRKSIQCSRFFLRETEKLFCCLSLDRNHSHRLEKIIIPKEIKSKIISHFLRNKEIITNPYRYSNDIDFWAGVYKSEYSSFDKEKILTFLSK
jgi:hypothetical protein